MINNRYTIKKKLGEGRSKVFLCTDAENPYKEFAIKILPSSADKDEINIFRKEFFTLQNFNHPNIIASHDEGVIVTTDGENEISTGSRFIILDFFEGTELLKFERINDYECLKEIIKQICSVLYYLHQSNYIYYDLKPKNILVGEKDGIINLKLIDMGFAHHLSSSAEYISRGTKEYIAPEILKREHHSHQVDLYSLGILLYKIVYKRFPFTSDSEVEIFKEHIEREFDYPQSDYPSELIEVIKKLLEKNPVNRFDNSLQVLNYLGYEIDQDIAKYFTPANVFSDRQEQIEHIKNFFNDNKSKEVIILSGAEGSGKTTLLYKIYSDYEKVILISTSGRRSGIGFIRILLKKIIYNDFIYTKIDREVLQLAHSVIDEPPGNLIDKLKSIFTSISSKVKFNLIIDDFNLLDDFLIGIFSEILPILQVNGVNIIISERSDHNPEAEKFINKYSKISLVPFTKENLSEYLDDALATFFPKDQLKKLILKFSDLIPGSIVSFIRDLILLKIINFNYDGTEITEDENIEKLLKGSAEEIFRLRFSLLTDEETKITQFISSFAEIPPLQVIASYFNLTINELNKIIKSLEEKNILQASNIDNAINFTSDSLKNYTYSTINNKEEYHLHIAHFLLQNFEQFNKQELARHFEAGRDYDSAYKIYLEEIASAEKLSAYSYIKNILNHLLGYQLKDNQKNELRFKLANTYYRLNDFKSALEVVEEALKNNLNENLKNEFLIIKGSSLIESGELSEGKEILNKLIKKINDEKRKQKILVEIAYAEFDLGKFEVAEDYAKNILANENTSIEEKAKCYNLLGLVEIYLRNDLEKSLAEFKKSLNSYKEINSVLQAAKLERNIGNIYNMMGEHNIAEEYWDSSHKKNLSIGNLDLEAKHLLNYGIYYYEFASYDEAVKQYKDAAEIFSVLGNKHGEGLAYTNLGEVNIDICNYSEAYKYLTEAKEIFSSLNNPEEKNEVLFLLGKLFSISGDNDELEKIIEEYKSEINEASERHKNNIDYLEALQGKKSGREILQSIKEKYLELNDTTNYAKANITYSEFLISEKKYTEAFDAINEKDFLNICSKNLTVKAYREYLTGEVASGDEKLNIPNPLNNFNSCYEILKDSHVSELTWKVMLRIGEIYFSRGNYSKAETFVLYAKKLIYFIAEHITDEIIKEKYLSKPERFNALQKAENLEKKILQ